ncbi:MAG: MlaD family protein [Candidatus Babeliales bacterium]
MLQIKTETRVGIFILVALGIFFFMSFKLGVFRLDSANYNTYTVYFSDLSGIEKKGDVKIAGVTVGWIEDLGLIDDGRQASALIRVSKEYVLREDACATVRQEGLLGTKYLEVMPGDPALPRLGGGDSLGKPCRSQVSFDDLLHKVKSIADNVEEITGSLAESVGGEHGKHQMRETINNIHLAAERFASFSEAIDRTLSGNEQSISGMITDFSEFARDIREQVPVLKESIERIASVFDRDFNRVAGNVEQTAKSLEDAALQARDGFRNINSVAEKIDQGKGLLGKLVNEEETYNDIKFAVRGLKNYFAKVDALTVVFDTHGEYMFRPAEYTTFEDSKGYLDIRIHPTDDYFYLAQLVGTMRGNLTRKWVEKEWFDELERPLLTSELIEKGVFIPELIGNIRTTKRKFDTFKFGLQFARIYKDIALRFGLMESSVGVGIDVEIPFDTDNFRWVTTFEAFDFRGRDRIEDSRPHLKWINRLFILNNIYMTFGADDFISRHNANAFFGAGVRFGDDDIKYLASRIAINT